MRKMRNHTHQIRDPIWITSMIRQIPGFLNCNQRREPEQRVLLIMIEDYEANAMIPQFLILAHGVVWSGENDRCSGKHS